METEKASVNVMIVDDSPINIDLLQEILGSVHPEYNIIRAMSGAEALEKIKETIPDIFLLDVMMPDMDGFELCEKLKSIEKYKDTPVLLVTALEKTEQKIRGFQVGASDYIVKPVNADETVARVNTHLGIKIYQDKLKDVNTKLEAAQSALVESAKMSAVGSLAAGVAHEFSNVMTMMEGHVKLSKTSESLIEVRETLEIVDELAQRGKKIIQGLLSFSRGDEDQEMTPANVCEVIDRDILLMKKMINDAEVVIEKAFTDVPSVMCHPNELSQAFVNIIKNAIEAMKDCEDKKIIINILSVDFANIPEKIKTQIEQFSDNIQKCIVVKISDNGPGIPKEMIEKIYEPFTSTKGVLHGGDDTTPGTGLGLSITYGIVKRHGGYIDIESEINKGTSFIITLPVLGQAS